MHILQLIKLSNIFNGHPFESIIQKSDICDLLVSICCTGINGL